MNAFEYRSIYAVILALTTTSFCSAAVTYSAAQVNCENPPSKVLLLRHGCKLDSSSDSPLSATGLKQAEELVQRLGHFDLEAIFVTKKARTQQTAQDLSKHKGLDLQIYSDTTRATKKVVKKMCTDYSSKEVLYVGHSYTLGYAIRALIPDFAYASPAFAEGWIVVFEDGKPAHKRLPISKVRCE